MTLPFAPGSFGLADPWALAALLLVAAALAVVVRRARARGGGVLFSSHTLLAGLGRSRRAAARHVLLPLRAAAVVLIVVALARPQLSQAAVEVPAEGIDIVLALDVSSSMTQGDFGGGLSKIDASKKVITDFLGTLGQDRVGIVVFAGRPLVLSPLTLDYDAPKKLLEPIKAGRPVPDGTAIGNGLAMAVALLRDSQAKAKAVVLLTDGENNMGDVEPLDASQLARVLGVHVYTIGAVLTAPDADNPDERMLQRMADVANGKYFRVSDAHTLANVYQEIHSLERSRVGTRTVGGGTEDLQLPFLTAALGLLLLEVALSTTLLRRTP